MSWDVDDRVIWVVGLARSGCAAGGLLRQRGARVLGVDDADERSVRRRWEREGLSKLAPEAFDELHTGGAWPSVVPFAVVISPGVPGSHPQLAALPPGVPVLGEVELGSRFCAAPLVGVTGTNGKSTVTDWLAHVVRGAGRRAEAVGNLGRPLCTVAEELTPHDLAVVEVSSFQLETVSTFRPQVGLVLNLAPDHLDRYEDLTSYYRAKRILAEKVATGGTYLAWTGCPEAAGWSSPGRTVLFGEEDAGASIFYRDKDLYIQGDGECSCLLASDRVALDSPPNLLNALAVAGAARALGIPGDATAAGLAGYGGLAHRHELVALRDGVRFVNDSKATNVHAVVSGLDGYGQQVVLILGGSGKGEDYRPLREVMGPVRHVVTIGAEGPVVAAALADVVAVTAAPDMDRAVALAADLAAPDAVVLLSPACASFDMFTSYRQRGAAFKAAALAAGAAALDPDKEMP
ncbi:UDP-N-acetylmuramoyl-L-alanine--D-glutamate ligase [bacterium]|nr:MAG: UDP-N-acetylmuramoyl-L-alanine--D-glutamate ligase [bacterium]